MEKLNILVVEDGQTQREMLRDFLRDNGYNVAEAANGTTALETVAEGFFNLLLVDYKMPGINGMEVLEAVRRMNPETDVIMMTAYGTVDTAVRAIKAGAADYITKPIELEELLLLVQRISERRGLLKENKILRERLKNRIVYQSSAMEQVIRLAERVASSRASILIQGESGTGKELVARMIHRLSPRFQKPLVVLNCAALPESLLESELFGHEKGAFTGASQKRIGRFEEADGGTLFLDEIGDLSAAVQIKLLRFLQEHELQRVGGNQTIRSDVRIISATNRNLEEHVKSGLFREDLFYRLNVVTIDIPPLRDRKEDLLPLINHFLKHFAMENEKVIERISPEARELLLRYDYRGNVRELENIMERAVVIAENPVISGQDLLFAAGPLASSDKSGILPGRTMKESMENLELHLIRKAMDESGGRQTMAADHLGISERMLRYKLKKYNLK
ncbi:MAG: sigma-54 dependent transcriptional regulator [Desulfobacterales bacterium]|nr:sigma-54 dependent transcriptional regulator [Desulfobacterales bacterium]